MPPKIQKIKNLTSPGLWDAFDTYVKVFRRASIFPFVYNHSEKQLKLRVLPNWKIVWIKLSSSLMPLVTSVFLLIFLHKLKYGQVDQSDGWETARMLICVFIVTLLPCCTCPSFLAAFRPKYICHAMNPIEQCGSKVSGNT